MRESNIACSPFAVVRGEQDVDAALEDVQLPAVLKTSQGGYDGKGQATIKERQDLKKSFKQFKDQACTLEQWVDLHLEVSVLIARDNKGNLKTFGPIENQHKKQYFGLELRA